VIDFLSLLINSFCGSKTDYLNVADNFFLLHVAILRVDKFETYGQIRTCSSNHLLPFHCCFAHQKLFWKSQGQKGDCCARQEFETFGKLSA
jgi:hypothetical protein